MKKSEKLFLAINEIDEKLIKNAKAEEQRPIEIRPERRSPIKGIIALAACIAVLAVGVFALLKFKLGGNGIEPAPIRNGSDSSVSDSASYEYDSSDTDSSDSSDDNSDSRPKIELTLTEQDIELQAILKDLITNATDIDGIFTRLSEQGEGYREKVNDTDYSGIYYPILDGRRTEPSGLFAIPQTRSELEQLLLTCFTQRAVKYYMDDIGEGHMMIDTDGKNVIFEDSDRGGQKTVIEIGGRLYHMSWREDEKLDIDYTTAQVKSETEKTIRFTYYDSSGTPGETEGVIIFENGGWKLDFFHGEFIPELPTEFTEEDLELQEILNELSPADTVFCWFDHGAFYDGVEYFSFRFNDQGGYQFYALMPKGEKASYGDLEYPQSCEEVEELLLKYFSRNTVDKFMRSVGKGTMTENPDGTYTVTTDAAEFIEYNVPPAFIEIDGNMYLHDLAKGGPSSPIWDTAQITEKTADSIRFTIIHTMYRNYWSKPGLIRYERGGWKLNYDFDGIADE